MTAARGRPSQTPKNFPDGRKGYFRQSSDQIGVTETNDFIFGDLHRAMRQQLFAGLTAGNVTDAMDRVCAELGNPKDDFVSSAAHRILERSQW